MPSITDKSDPVICLLQTSFGKNIRPTKKEVKKKIKFAKIAGKIFKLMFRFSSIT